MRVGFKDQDGERRPVAAHINVASRSSDLIPLYDINQFAGLIERERARADRAAVRSPHTLRRRGAEGAAKVDVEARADTPRADLHRHRSAAPAPAAVAKAAVRPAGGQPKPSSEGVWGATTNNREFSLVMFRPRKRADRTGLVELLQGSVRTTDAVGIIDNRRLGVLLPDTSAENAILFVKKVMAQAQEQAVELIHIVHTYPAAWPREANPQWHEGHASDDSIGAAAIPADPSKDDADHSVVRGLVGWLQAVRRPSRRNERAPV